MLYTYFRSTEVSEIPPPLLYFCIKSEGGGKGFGVAILQLFCWKRFWNGWSFGGWGNDIKKTSELSKAEGSEMSWPGQNWEIKTNEETERTISFSLIHSITKLDSELNTNTVVSVCKFYSMTLAMVCHKLFISLARSCSIQYVRVSWIFYWPIIVHPHHT